MVIDGIPHLQPERGIGQAHTEAIKHAKIMGLDKICIMEDDIVFQGKEKTIPYFNECLNNLPSDWNILMGGVYNRGATFKENEYWNKLTTFCGLHFYIVNANCYDKLLTWNGIDHFDRWISKQNLSIFVTDKYIAHQMDGYSDNAKANTKYNDEHLDIHRLL
jgi:GR25 family glycosyltransferase involved in LPS biosynthesis